MRNNSKRAKIQSTVTILFGARLGVATQTASTATKKVSAALRQLFAGALLVLPIFVYAEAVVPSAANAEATDPAKMGWMQGSPPPENRIIRFADGSYFRFPATRWSFSNFRRLMPTINVSRGLNATATLSQALRDDIDDIRFTPGDTSTSMRWSDSLLENYTDAVLILHQGKVVYERYFGVSSPTGQHGVMSITKTFVGTLASALIAEGVLDPGKLVTDYVPELAGSAFAGATLQQVLDMTTGIRFNEDYANPKADIWVHAKAGSPLPMPKDYQGPRSYYEFLQQTVAEGKHGEAFHYRTINTDALGWIIARATDKPLDQLLSARIWQKLGVEQDA
ncbi:MAG: serine hydrolase, partial [Pseudomonadales bacterium]|nr:serine hydrolase [Pseudomonadales bacterium]